MKMAQCCFILIFKMRNLHVYPASGRSGVICFAQFICINQFASVLFWDTSSYSFYATDFLVSHHEKIKCFSLKYCSALIFSFSSLLLFYDSVLVHSGGVQGGHYYAFIRPKLSDLWYVFYFWRIPTPDHPAYQLTHILLFSVRRQTYFEVP